MSEYNLPTNESDRIAAENTCIADRLKTMSANDREQVMLAVDVLRNAGSAGLHPVQWSNAIGAASSVNWSLHFRSMSQTRSILSDMIETISVPGQGTRYAWIGYDQKNSAIMHQAGLTYDAIKIMTKLPSFTETSLCKAFLSLLGLEQREALSFTKHMIEQMHGSLERTVNGYRMKREPVVTHESNMQLFRNLVAAVKGGGGQTSGL